MNWAGKSQLRKPWHMMNGTFFPCFLPLSQSLEGGGVLPGLTIRLADLFAKLEPST